jgi:hypothetical protein
MDIREALSNLDPFNDDQWTAEGAPKIDVLKELLGRPVTRQEITDAAPHFTRENFMFEDPAAPAEEFLPTFDAAVLVDFAEKEPMDVNSFLGFLATVPKEGLTYLQEILRKQQADVAASRKKLEDQDFNIRGAMVYTKARITREIPDISEAEANRRYIAKQQELRAAKHAATVALLKGVDLKSLDPRSAIDRAMARKTTRGNQRPNVGQKA